MTTIIMAFVGIMLLSGGETNPKQENDRENLIKKLQLLESLDLGFGPVNRLPSETVDKLSDVDLTSYVNTVNDQVPCGYVHRALEHNRLVEPALRDHYKSFAEIIPWTLMFSILFKSFYTAMMYHVVDHMNSISNLMWIFHEHVETIREYLNTVNDHVDSRENRLKVLASHEILNKMLVEHLTSVEQCIDNYRTQSVQLTLLSTNSDEDHRVWLHSITLAINEICEKPNRPPETNVHKQPCLKRMLRLNNTLSGKSTVLADILKQLLIDKQKNNIADKIKNPIALQNDKNLDYSAKIQNSGQILRDFLGILKTIVLKKSLNYLKQARIMILTNSWQGTIEYLEKHNKEMSTHLFEFVNVLFMGHDKDIQLAIDIFNTKIIDFIPQVGENQNHLPELFLNVVLKLYHDNALLKRLTVNENLYFNLYDKELEDANDICWLVAYNSSSTGNLVEYIRRTFAKIDFKIIYSFVQVRDSKELHRFNQLTEENHSLKTSQSE